MFKERGSKKILFAEFYNGSIAEQIVYSVKLAEGNMTLDDISQYQTVKSNQIKTSFNGFTILTSESSSGGALLLNCLNHIEVRNFFSSKAHQAIKIQVLTSQLLKDLINSNNFFFSDIRLKSRA